MITAGGMQLSTGWDVEIKRETAPGSNTFEVVTDRAEVCRVVYRWLGLIGEVNWSELVDASWESDGLMWMVPLGIGQMSELVTGRLYLHEIVTVDGVNYNILIDLTDSF